MEQLDRAESKQIHAISLLETIDQEFADDISFFRSNTFIVNENDNEKDEKILREMGYDAKMIKKVYLFLKPENIEQAIEFMTEILGKYQHDFLESRGSSSLDLCYICKKEKQYHKEYDEENEKISLELNTAFIHNNDRLYNFKKNEE